jgi:predicted lipoprotein with Yx(FWY)xxD motif
LNIQSVPVRPYLALAALASVATIALTQLAAASAANTAAATKIALHKTSKGTILVDSRGYTIYAFTLDKGEKDACAGIFECLSEWPAVTTKSSVTAGPGIKKSLIGTIKFRGSKRQLTYAGHPLYTYVEDTKPAQTSNINILQFQGRWPALNAPGKLVK